MDIKEARQVLWLKSDRRPLGELLDEGYLTQARLEWAADKAYDPKLREAAQVFLKLLPAAPRASAAQGRQKLEAKPFDVGIKLDDARAQPWPFAPYRDEPMGPLVDSRQLTWKDLGFAIDTAWNESVKKSAVALLLHRLRQTLKEPPPRAGIVQVTSGGRSYADRMQLWLTFLRGGIMGLLVALMLMLIVWTIRYVSTPRPASRPVPELLSTPTGLVALGVFVVLTAIAYWTVLGLPEYLDRRLEKQIDEFHRGEEGEERAVQVILQALDGTWRVFRNVGLPGRNRGDLDLILVGPPGVWALEVKNWNGEYRNIGDTWEYKAGKAWKPCPSRPSQQAHKNAIRLGEFLRADGLHEYVKAAVVWANPESALSVENPTVAVWKLERLQDELGNVWQGKQLTAASRDKIIEKLTRLCERQRDLGQAKK